MITIDWRPSPAHLRRWALTAAAGLAVSGSLFQFVDWGIFRVGQGIAPWLWGFGGLVLVTGVTGTRLGWPAYWAWMGLAWLIGTTLGILALAVVFYLVVTPLAIAARLAGRDRLGLVRPASGESLWTTLPAAPHDPARQF